MAVGERFRTDCYGPPGEVWIVLERWDPDPIALCANEASTDEETFGFAEDCEKVDA